MPGVGVIPAHSLCTAIKMPIFLTCSSGTGFPLCTEDSLRQIYSPSQNTALFKLHLPHSNSLPFFLSFSLCFFVSLHFFWDSYGLNVGALALFQKSLRLSSFLFLLFSLFHFYLPAYYLFFCLSYSTVGSLQSIFNSVISLFFSD